MRNGLLIGLLAVLIAATGEAATQSVQMQVTVRVVPNCRISVTDLAFGAYDPLIEHADRSLDGTALVRVTCTRNERATVLLEENGTSIRSLRSGSFNLTYGIFSDPARTQTWGAGANGVQVLFDGSRDPKELTVYGRIPAGQVVPAGTYSDAVTATVDF